MSKRLQKDTSSTFLDNMSLPVHRWFRYSAGFSAEWVEETVAACSRQITPGRTFRVLDPFAGSGTTLLACDRLGVPSCGYEAHPLIYRIAAAKLLWESDANQFFKAAEDILTAAQNERSDIGTYPDPVTKCYDEKNLAEIDSLKKALYSRKGASSSWQLSWLAFVSILRSASHAGTASWQYVLPNKKKVRVLSAYEAYSRQIALMYEDMKRFQECSPARHSVLLAHDARQVSPLEQGSIDLVITSPPYANNFDYADATRLELSVLGKISSWGELQSKIRPGLVRSCSQMVSREKKDTFHYLEDPLLSPIYSEIQKVCTELDQEKEKHGGKKLSHDDRTLFSGSGKHMDTLKPFAA